MKPEFDIVIIGAGLTGGLAADYFTRIGKNVCIIERGGDYFPDRKNLWSERHINVPGTNRWVTVSKDDPYERTEIKTEDSDYKFKYNMKFGMGGAGAVWSGASFRFRPADFRLRSMYGVGDDWPITYDDLEPWYALAENELGVSGSDPFSYWQRSSDYPMDAFRQSFLDGVFMRHFGKKFPLMPIPCAVASEKYRGRGPCIGAHSCVSFCPSEARYNPNQNHLTDAIERESCTLYKRAMVTRLNMDDNTYHVKSVTVLPEGSAPIEVKAEKFILAGNTVENTRLLLLSGNSRFPQGLANSSGLVGKNFMSTGACVWNLEFPEFTYPFRGRPITSVCAEYSDGNHRRFMSSFLIEVWNDVWTHGGLYYYIEKLVAQGHWGTTLKGMVDEYMRKMIITAPFEILPRMESTITLDPDDTDAFGLALPVNHIKLGDYEYGVREYIEKRLKNASPDILISVSGAGINGNHPYGTYRMGKNSREGVVDANLRSFDHENLYIMGGGSFVTGTCFNPTLTIAALALKALASMG
ncbi:putative FAD dependent oxidoreductase [Desulfamplus magnetovallimortis]|uniref:Putative FAD dependent oxidoreductase n=1 Tax=Desulfamplus magnetovallimortis TaxID=1246637 RepID=A0A1W1HC63_9BACT|nr:GMC family oxidoreductase [Desulfamplus magnetovallimortis]SLM29975.1 putative FAD dependent oxidoreductase [Desulfamplus magnetovallimortis]